MSDQTPEGVAPDVPTPSLLDLRALSDEEFRRLRIEVATENERRADMMRLPAQIADMRKRFLDGGGDPSLLT